MRLKTWFEALNNCQMQGVSYVLITVVSAAGSTPREAGCKMVVTGVEQFDTIGGGHLEFDAVNKAREFLLDCKQTQQLVSYPLSSKLGQCCGGAVKVLFEVFVNHYQHIAIFGAGHVASSLVPILAQLPVQISWIDSRSEFLAAFTPLQNVTTITNDEPVDEIPHFPENTWVIILTHNHHLDYALVEACFKSRKIHFVGMIGSNTKAIRFCTRLKHRGFSEEQIKRLVSPIGDPIVPGKRPVEVAVSISAQIIQKLHQRDSFNKHGQALHSNAQNSEESIP